MILFWRFVSNLACIGQWFQKLQLRVHGLTAAPGWSCCVGNGSQDLIHKSFQVFTDPGDPILIES